MKSTGNIESRLAIREFYGSFAHASSFGLTEDWMAHWADECTWETPHFAISGKARVREQWNALWATFESVALIHEICAIRCEINSASAVCIAREIIQMRGGAVYKLAGCYEDALVLEGGNWMFTDRRYRQLVEEAPLPHA